MSSGCATIASARVQSSGRGSSGGGVSMGPSMPSNAVARQARRRGWVDRMIDDLGDRPRPTTRRCGRSGTSSRPRSARRSPTSCPAATRSLAMVRRAEPLLPPDPARGRRWRNHGRGRRHRALAGRQRAPRRARGQGRTRPAAPGDRAGAVRRRRPPAPAAKAAGSPSGRPTSRPRTPTWRRRRTPSPRRWAAAPCTRRPHLVLDLPASPTSASSTPSWEIVTWGNRCPDDLTEAYCAMRTQMENDVPRGEIDYEPFVFDEAAAAGGGGADRCGCTTRSSRWRGVAGRRVRRLHPRVPPLRRDPRHAGRHAGDARAPRSPARLAPQADDAGDPAGATIPSATAVHTWTAPDNQRHAAHQPRHRASGRWSRMHEMQCTIAADA